MNSKQLRWRCTLLLLATLSIAAHLWPAAGVADDDPKPQPISGKIKWVYDYKKGQLASQETGKPMFVVFRCER